MEDLSSVLWRERELLDLLLFKLEVEQLVLATGRSRWLAPATREIEAVLQHIREVELLRAVAVDTVAAQLGSRRTPACSRSLPRAPTPGQPSGTTTWRPSRTVATQITEMSQSNRALLTAGYQAAQATLLSMAEQSGTTYALPRLDRRRPPRQPASTGTSDDVGHLLLPVHGALRAALQPRRDGRRQRQRGQRRHRWLRTPHGDRPGDRCPRRAGDLVALERRRRRGGGQPGRPDGRPTAGRPVARRARRLLVHGHPRHLAGAFRDRHRRARRRRRRGRARVVPAGLARRREQPGRPPPAPSCSRAPRPCAPTIATQATRRRPPSGPTSGPASTPSARAQPLAAQLADLNKGLRAPTSPARTRAPCSTSVTSSPMRLAELTGGTVTVNPDTTVDVRVGDRP